jgi:hypothetical protein
MLGSEAKENSLTGKTVQNFVTSPSLSYDSVKLYYFGGGSGRLGLNSDNCK